MGFQDLRQFVQKVDDLGEMRTVAGADWDLEMGAVTEVAASSPACPMVLFDKIKGYQAGYRVVCNLLHTERRVALALGESPELKGVGLVKKWKEKMGEISKGPMSVEVENGPVTRNRLTGSDVNILKFPIPRWHELDGGRYIAGAVSVLRDPESNYVNLGVFRLQVQDESTLCIYVSPGKHSEGIMRKYWRSGENCPIAISLGHSPSVFMAGAIGVPYGISEYRAAGAINGEAIQVVSGKHTGLPVPASGEVVLEGEIPPKERVSRNEGPFGEATGFYASGEHLEPVVRIKTIMFRDDPIIQGAPPMKPLRGMFHIPFSFGCALLWQQLEACGMASIQGIWEHSRGVTVISLKQMYAGHAKQVALIAAGSRATFTARFIVTVDEDIDPCNLSEVMWAISQRCDPSESVEIVKNCWTDGVDPVVGAEKRETNNITTSKVIIDACTPRWRKGGFPTVIEVSPAMKAKVLEKWPELIR